MISEEFIVSNSAEDKVDVVVGEDKINVLLNEDRIEVTAIEDNITVTFDAMINYTLLEFTWVQPPATRNSLGTVGQMSFDNDYVYICYATDSWGRWIITKGW